MFCDIVACFAKQQCHSFVTFHFLALLGTFQCGSISVTDWSVTGQLILDVFGKYLRNTKVNSLTVCIIENASPE